LYSHEVEYELLGTATAEACMGSDQLKDLHDYRSADPRAIGHGVLFEGAKFDAIQKLVGCDGLVALRSKVELKNGFECTTVTGRCYRILSMRATAGHPAGERTKAPPHDPAPVQDPPPEARDKLQTRSSSRSPRAGKPATRRSPTHERAVGNSCCRD
jgi:hypothetical protein